MAPMGRPGEVRGGAELPAASLEAGARVSGSGRIREEREAVREGDEGEGKEATAQGVLIRVGKRRGCHGIEHSQRTPLPSGRG